MTVISTIVSQLHPLLRERLINKGYARSALTSRFRTVRRRVLVLFFIDKERETVVVVVVGKMGITGENARRDGTFFGERVWIISPHSHNAAYLHPHGDL
jgi:hypothetical protein